MESQGTPLSQGEQEQHIQTRAETMRSIEDAEKYKALDTLAELGLLIPLREAELFHGRVGKKGEQWQVNPHFSNAGDDTGNRNINARSTLYGGEKKVANDIARTRGGWLVLPKYREIFEDRVKNYTSQQKQEWLERINDEEKAQLDASRQKHPDLYRNTRLTQYSLDDLEKLYLIETEAERLEKDASQEEKNLLWETASKEFSETLQIETHQIVSDDPDASIIDLRFSFSKLSNEDQQKYKKALTSLLLPMTEGAPVDFDDREKVEPVMKEIVALRKSLISHDEIDEISQKTGIDKKLVTHLASAHNSRNMAAYKPKYLAGKLLDSPNNIIDDTFTIDGQEQEVPINLEYAERFMRSAHIVATVGLVYSATLERDNVPTFSFFDLEKIGTREQLEDKKHTMRGKMGGLVAHLPELLKSEASGPAQELLFVLDDAYAKPETLIEAVKKIEGYATIFDSDTGNWEGFTLAEHTETVLRNFEENFADVVPVEYIALLRLTLLVHDLGKPSATAQEEKEKQEEYNRAAAQEFLSTIGIEQRVAELITALITEGSKLAFQLQKQSGDSALQVMHSFAQETLQRYLGSDEVSEPQARAFIGMCKIVQLCDGGAYTSMAITRRDRRGRFRNAPSFNASFSPPVSLGKRDIRYK